MKSIVGIYESYEKAIDALNELKEAGYELDQISILGKADSGAGVEDQTPRQGVEEAEIGVGVVAGSILGVLTGIGMIAIPGLGFLYGAGAIVGAVAGLEMGIVGGGVAAILTKLGIDEARSHKYAKLIDANKFIVFVQGTSQQIEHAKDVLHTSGHHEELEHHL